MTNTSSHNSDSSEPVDSASTADSAGPVEGAAGAVEGAGSTEGAEDSEIVDTLHEELGLSKQLIRFVLTGGMSAVVDYGTTALCTFLFGLSSELAKTFGFILGTLTAYFINRRWTFRAEASTKRFLVTMATYVVTFAVQWTLYNRVGLPWLRDHDFSEFWVVTLAFVFAQGVATIINFLIQRFVIFRN